MATTVNNYLMVQFQHAAPGSLDHTLTRPVIVFDGRGRVTTQAAVATTCQLLNAAVAITDAYSLGNNQADRMGRATMITDASYAIAAGGTLRSTLVGADTTALNFAFLYPTG